MLCEVFPMRRQAQRSGARIVWVRHALKLSSGLHTRDEPRDVGAVDAQAVGERGDGQRGGVGVGGEQLQQRVRVGHGERGAAWAARLIKRACCDHQAAQRVAQRARLSLNGRRIFK